MPLLSTTARPGMRARSSSSSAAASSTSPSTTRKCGSAHQPQREGFMVPAVQPRWNDGAGNPPNADGLKTDYLWKRILTRASLSDIIENYAQVVRTRDENTGRRCRCRSGRATTSSISCVACSRIPVPTAQASATSSSTRRQRQVELHRLARPPAHRAAEVMARTSSTRSALVTDRRILDQQIRTPSASSHRIARRWGMRSIRVTCASSSARARRSSSPPSKVPIHPR